MRRGRPASPMHMMPLGFSFPPCGGGARFLPPPLRAGLLHISKELEEELFLPRGKLHFSGDSPVEGVRSQNVERDAANDGEIFWGVILAGSRVVFVEDNVEFPMEVVLNAPM